MTKSRAVLSEVVAKAVRDPDGYPGLTLTYDRGHEMSGVTHFEVRADGRFTLTADNPRRGTRVAREGTLDPAQRHTILRAIEETRLLEQPSSTRNIGDDEQPITVEVRHEGEAHRLEIWARDARESSEFASFEAVLRGVIAEVAAGEDG